MKHAITVQAGSQVIGVYSNLKKAYDTLETPVKQGYSTIALTLAVCKPYDVGTCVIAGRQYENVVLRKFEVNALS